MFISPEEQLRQSRLSQANPAPRLDEPLLTNLFPGLRAPVEDPYQPLEDSQNPETIAWYKKETARYSDFVRRQEGFARYKQILKDNWDFEQETPRNSYGGVFISTYHDGRLPLPVQQVRETIDGEARTLLDPHVLDAEGSLSIRTFHPSPDGKIVAYLVAEKGGNKTTLKVKDIATGEESATDIIPDCLYTDVKWEDKGSTSFLYTKKGEGNSSILRRHIMGQSHDNDQTIFTASEKDSSVIFVHAQDEHGNATKTSYLQVRTPEPGGKVSYSLYAKNPDAEDYTKILDNLQEHSVIGENHGKLIVQVFEDAGRGKMVAIDPAQPDKEHWRTIIPEQDEDLMQSAFLHQGKLYVKYLHHLVDEISVYDTQGVHLHDIPLPGECSVTFGKPKTGDTQLPFTISRFDAPDAVYFYDTENNTLEMAAWEKQRAKKQATEVPIISSYMTAISEDGTEIPMRVVHREDVKLDGSAALKLHSYGGYNKVNALVPQFRPNDMAWIQEGGIYALAAVRGGGELGKEWHDAGRKENIYRRADDFAACAKRLAEEQPDGQQYSQSKRIITEGRSAGGMLVLAAAMLYPDDFGGVISHVPRTDLIGFTREPGGVSRQNDLGDSSTREGFDGIMRFSPLHNIRKDVDYPPILISTGENDQQVLPRSSYKFAASMKDIAKNSLCLLHVEPGVGHGNRGQDWPVAKRIEAQAGQLAFAESVIGPINQNRYKEALAARTAGNDNVQGWGSRVNTAGRGQIPGR